MDAAAGGGGGWCYNVLDYTLSSFDCPVALSRTLPIVALLR